MTTALTTEKIFKDRSDAMEYWKKETAILRKHQKAFTRAIKHVNTVFARHTEINAYSWTSVQPWMKDAPVTLHMSVTHEVTSMKEGIAPAFMRSLLEAGFDVETTTDTTNALDARRTFVFVRPSSESMVHMKLVFNAQLVDAPDATCRKVQIGTKMVEVPSYQLVCEE